MKTLTFILPTHYASALINSDMSGLEEEDTKKLNDFVDRQVEKHGSFYCVDADVDNAYFTHGHDMNRNEGADVCLFTFRVGEPERKQTKDMKALLTEFKALKEKLFAGGTFVVMNDDSIETKRYNQLFQFFHPEFRTKQFINPLN